MASLMLSRARRNAAAVAGASSLSVIGLIPLPIVNSLKLLDQFFQILSARHLVNIAFIARWRVVPEHFEQALGGAQERRCVTLGSGLRLGVGLHVPFSPWSSA